RDRLRLRALRGRERVSAVEARKGDNMSKRIDTRKVLILAALLVAIAGYGIRAASLSDGGEEPEIRYRVDAARHRVWLLTLDGVVVDEASPARRTTVTLPEWQWLLQPWGCLPDLALGPDGEAVV